jgi:hypothetical protein
MVGSQFFIVFDDVFCFLVAFSFKAALRSVGIWLPVNAPLPKRCFDTVAL